MEKDGETRWDGQVCLHLDGGAVPRRGDELLAQVGRIVFVCAHHLQGPSSSSSSSSCMSGQLPALGEGRA